MTLSEAIDWDVAEFLLRQHHQYSLPTCSSELRVEVERKIVDDVARWSVFTYGRFSPRKTCVGQIEASFDQLADALVYGLSPINQQMWTERKKRTDHAAKCQKVD